MILKIKKIKNTDTDSSDSIEIININIFSQENPKISKSFDINPEDEDNTKIKDMFYFILDNINCNWEYDETEINVDSIYTIDKVISKFLEVIKYEIEGIKKQLTDIHLLNKND